MDNIFNQSNLDPRTQKAKDKYEGMILDTVDGTAKFEIVKFNSAADIEIHFLGTNLTQHKTHYQVFRSGIYNPFATKEPGIESPVYFEDPYKRWVGCYFKTNQGYIIKIIDYQGVSKVTVQFQDEHGYIMTTTIQNIQKGQVFNPYHPNKYGAYLGEGPFMNNMKKYVHIYNRWKNMLERTLNTENYLAHHGYATKAYDNCSVVQPWLVFNNFAQWYANEEAKLNPNYEYEIDKDIKYFLYKVDTNRSKMYGPSYCVLMPHDLNTSIIAILNGSDPTKTLQLADKYYADNAITQDTYLTIYQAANFYCGYNKEPKLFVQLQGGEY